MVMETSFKPGGFSERIDYWVSIKNWPWMFRLHRVMYRLSRGRLGGVKRGIPVMLLTTTGRRTNQKRTVPLMYLQDGDRYVIVGSNAGLDRDPDWCFNLRHHAEAKIQVGQDIVAVTARDATKPDRQTLWPRLVELNPLYQGFQEQTQRQIPIVILEARTRDGSKLERRG